ncbi:MAG: glycosyltransferase [Ruminococcaceae bacterium]|nr:glycosyltransferase [Oscillospiraceae bacterium]
MKILHVISDENIGGAGILLTNLLSLFDRERVESTVALPQRSKLYKRIEEMGIKTIPLYSSVSGFSLPSVRELCRCIRETHTELIHANAALCARIAGRICGVPVVHTRHCCFSPSFVWHIPLVKQLGGLGNRVLSDRVIATAEAAAENLHVLGIPQKKIKVIVNGSKPVREADEEELTGLRDALGLKSTDFVVGICARLEACKGHTTFLKAARIVLDHCHARNVRFLIIGEGSARASLESLAEELGISDAVRFVGFVSDLAPYYHLMNVNVNCSVGTETSSLALSEGMSAGLPMIASDFGGNPAMIGDGRAGFLFPARSDSALAECICRIASDVNLESSMRREARARYEHFYTAERMADEVTSLYQEVLQKQRGLIW